MTTTEAEPTIPSPSEVEEFFLEPIEKLARDVRATATAEKLPRDQAKVLVNLYYKMQAERIATGNQARALRAVDASAEVVTHFEAQFRAMEGQMQSVLDYWSMTQPVGRWSRSILGIGPVIAAGLLAHIDIEKAPTVGKIWAFGGLDPTRVWAKGQKRPWNADLKQVFYKIGDSFVKISGREDAFYGQVYRARKEQEVRKNEAGDFADQARKTLETKNIQEPATKATYEAGRLPPGRLDLRARRYATKLFLSHWHEVAYFAHYGVLPPLPYALTHLGHVDYISVPNAEMVEGLMETRKRYHAKMLAEAQGQR